MTVPFHNLTDTWASVGTVFDAIKMNVTDSGHASGSALLKLQVGGASKFTCDPSGFIQGLNTVDWVNVKAFGAVGDNVNDDTAAIQAAIDYAAANNLSTIYMPKGTYKITSPLYLDPPGNLRTNFANPPMASFSLTLIGDD